MDFSIDCTKDSVTLNKLFIIFVLKNGIIIATLLLSQCSKYQLRLYLKVF